MGKLFFGNCLLLQHREQPSEGMSRFGEFGWFSLFDIQQKHVKRWNKRREYLWNFHQ